jgi:hypothetical protein
MFFVTYGAGFAIYFLYQICDAPGLYFYAFAIVGIPIFIYV